MAWMRREAVHEYLHCIAAKVQKKLD